MTKHLTATAPSAAGIACIALAAIALTGCSSGPDKDAKPAAADSKYISADRCTANQDAGTINFLTSYVYAASVGILDVVAAEELGYFDDLCLDVAMQPGVDNNAQLVSAGTAQIAGLGSASDTLIARDKDAKDIVAVATYGSQGAIELLTMADSGIDTLQDFAGKTVGYKGAISAQFSAMFKNNGVDPSSINWVSVGYDPQILPDGQVQGLGAFKSNEPKVLESRGYDIKEWAPEDYGVQSTFNTQIANKKWAEANPTAVEDFLRASFEAYAWINESDANLDKALGWAADRSESGYDLDASKVRWQTEVSMVESARDQSIGLGVQTEDQWSSELGLVVDYGLVSNPPSYDETVDDSYIDAIYDGNKLIWPAQ
ncbi:ABC transporter substrate-binding protein [Galbitalea sp. SE-J8]|uniref:ABC transporter substrate-binding protein n=1 Tax=Galbitalea sp. SE-J8 TaxID=3054952 RepID=UPI00259CBD4F|nr:ABC transporter substrate-binding protein [Galbitalea sp. SE-J8]MDM4764064.1 ABC transporter substrate-binding protein [Galbitalea sp. SE-J8]